MWHVALYSRFIVGFLTPFDTFFVHIFIGVKNGVISNAFQIELFGSHFEWEF